MKRIVPRVWLTATELWMGPPARSVGYGTYAAAADVGAPDYRTDAQLQADRASEVSGGSEEAVQDVSRLVPRTVTRADLRRVIETHNLPVSPQIEGNASRTRSVVVEELRACVGLPTLENDARRGAIGGFGVALHVDSVAAGDLAPTPDEGANGGRTQHLWRQTEASAGFVGLGFFYAVVGGPYPGVHVTPDYEATVSSVVDAFPDARVWGASEGVHDVASAARCLSLRGNGASVACSDHDVVVWVRSAAGYVGRRGHAGGQVVISPERQQGALPPAAQLRSGLGSSTSAAVPTLPNPSRDEPPSVFAMPPGTVIDTRLVVACYSSRAAAADAEAVANADDAADACSTSASGGSHGMPDGGGGAPRRENDAHVGSAPSHGAVVEEPGEVAPGVGRRGRITPWGGAAVAVTVLVLLASAWWPPVATNHNLVDATGYGPPVLHAADAAAATAVHAVSMSPFGRTCYAAAGLACAAGVLPQLARSLLPLMLATLLAAKRAIRRAPPAAPWLVLSMLLYVVGSAHGYPYRDGATCRGSNERGWRNGGLLGSSYSPPENVTTQYVGRPMAYATVL